jgi:hypothetical protein
MFGDLEQLGENGFLLVGLFGRLDQLFFHLLVVQLQRLVLIELVFGGGTAINNNKNTMSGQCKFGFHCRSRWRTHMSTSLISRPAATTQKQEKIKKPVNGIH